MEYKGGSIMRSYCLYNDKHVSIAEIFEIKDGKQINIPEKLAYYRPLSKNKQLSCSCGCGDIVILIAGEKNKRRQHFRLLRKSANSNCQYHEESDISFKSKIMLECWFKKNFSVMYCGMRYKVPISQLAENKRRYELSMYSKDYDIGIIYNRHIANILDEKLELLKEYVKTKIIYVTGVDNEETNGQYPEHMMRVQETQGFCFYLDLNKESLYEEVKAKVSFYEKTFRGLWKVVDVCCGMLDEFGINTDGLLVYKHELVIDLVDKRREKFQAEQKCKMEQIRKRDEEKKLRYEKESLEKAEHERLRLEKERKEEENRARVEKERQKQRELEQRRKKEERKVYNEKEDNSFLEKYPKYARIYKMLKEIKSIKGLFDSDQSNGKIKNYTKELEIDKIGINRDKHRIEILDSKAEKVYIYILEDDFNKVRVPGTGNLYKILDFTSIDDVENSFKSTFCCVYKEC